MATLRSLISLLPEPLRARLNGRENLQSIISNTGWLFTDRILRMAGGVIIGAWVARYLGPDQFGIVNYAIALVTIFSAVAALGLDSIVVHDIVREPSHRDEVLGTAFVLKLAGGVVMFGASLGAIYALRPGDPLMHAVVALTAAGLIFQPLDVIDFWFQSQVRSKYTVTVKNAAFLVVGAVRVVLILAGASLIAFVWASLLEVALGALGLAYAYRRAGGRFFGAWSMRIGRAKDLLKAAWPLIIQGFVILLYMRVDQVMLGELSSSSEVGNYSAAVRLVEVWYFIPMAITASLFPTIIRLKQNEPLTYRKRIQQLYDLMIWMAIIFAVLTTLCAAPVVGLLFGKEYQRASSVLTVQTWMAASVFFGVARQKWLTAEGFLKDGLQVELIGLVMNVSANIVLIPAYGAIGASVASLLSAFGSNIIAALYLRPIRESMGMYLNSLALPLRALRRAR